MPAAVEATVASRQHDTARTGPLALIDRLTSRVESEVIGGESAGVVTSGEITIDAVGDRHGNAEGRLREEERRRGFPSAFSLVRCGRSAAP